jgi:hypothetical protein
MLLLDTSKFGHEDDFLKVTRMTTVEALKDMKMVIKFVFIVYFHFFFE